MSLKDCREASTSAVAFNALGAVILLMDCKEASTSAVAAAAAGATDAGAAADAAVSVEDCREELSASGLGSVGLAASGFEALGLGAPAPGFGCVSSKLLLNAEKFVDCGPWWKSHCLKYLLAALAKASRSFELNSWTKWLLPPRNWANTRARAFVTEGSAILGSMPLSSSSNG